MLTENGAHFHEKATATILVMKSLRRFWDNDRLEFTTDPDRATVFFKGVGMESAGNVAERHLQMEVALGNVPEGTELMLEDVTDSPRLKGKVSRRLAL